MRNQAIDATFAALAHPTRRAILARLAAGESPVGSLAKPFSITPPAITKHLKVLENAGLIVRRREAQTLICRLNVAPLEAGANWLEFYRRFWEDSFDCLDDYLEAMKSATGPSPAPAARAGPAKNERR